MVHTGGAAVVRGRNRRHGDRRGAQSMKTRESAQNIPRQDDNEKTEADSERPAKRSKSTGFDISPDGIASGADTTETKPTEAIKGDSPETTEPTTTLLRGEKDLKAAHMHGHPVLGKDILSDLDLLDILKSHDVIALKVVSSSRIIVKATTIINHLSKPRLDDPAWKTGIAVLYAISPVASKAITIVEIAKRDIAKKGGKWYQYNVLDEVELPVPSPAEANRASEVEVPKNAEETAVERQSDGVIEVLIDNVHPAGTEAEDEYFEQMKEPRSARTKEKELPVEKNGGFAKTMAIPGIFIYLSTTRVEYLKRVYGEQTNA